MPNQFFLDNAILIPLLPLAAAILVGLFGTRILRGASHWPVILAVVGALVISAGLVGAVGAIHADVGYSPSQTHKLYDWMSPEGSTWFEVNILVDRLAAVMLVTVTAVSLLVVVYSRDYMREEGRPQRGYERFFAFLALFVFSMTLLVLAGNFLLLYLGWEAVGLCSYLLIGFYYWKPEAAAAAKKAFLVNRIGDFGFGLGILFIYLWIRPMVEPGRSPLDYEVVFDYVHRLSATQTTIIALLLFCGAVGKSAQLPLYVWLPDAMEGPSPVSALIHAATMVTAGVYMVVRCGAIFASSAPAMMVVASVGAITALYSATIALAQYDLKRILAYSTISQLGYMFLGVGVYAADSAIFHLFTHAFFKALLFLAAGSVMHALGGVIDVRRFGGLRRVLPLTYVTFLTGSLTLAGFPLLSGFWSKDEILHAAFAMHPVLGGIGLITAVLTAFYTFRMLFLAFHGPQRLPDGVHAHEAGAWMGLPLVLLSLGAIGAGFLGVRYDSHGFLALFGSHGWFHDFLGPSVEVFSTQRWSIQAESGDHAGAILMYVSGGIAVGGIVAAWFLFVRRRDLAAAVAAALPGAYEVVQNKYYIDELYRDAVVEPLRTGGRGLQGVDNYFLDGLVWLATAVPRGTAFFLRTMQRGAVQGYGLGMVFGLLVVLLLMLWSG
jgi:NADH-quinone oxidoreductase subunit L